MENVKKLKEIREYLKARNDKWWNEERTDLNLKYYVPTDMICEYLLDFEVGIPKNIYDEVLGGDDSYKCWNNSYSNYLEGHCIETFCGDNTYNFSGRPQNDISWQTFKMAENEYLVVMSFHIGGDIRGNYTDEIVLQFEYEVQFLEILNDISYEYGLRFDLEVDGKNYEITPFVLDECVEVYDSERDDYIYHIFGIDDEEVTIQIREQVEEIYKDNKQRIIKYMLDNKLINEEQYRDLEEKNIDIDKWNKFLLNTKDYILNNESYTQWYKEELIYIIDEIVKRECL